MRFLLLLACLTSAVAQWRPTLLSGAGAPTANCTVGWQYFQTDAVAGRNVWLCTATNVWTQQGGGTGGLFAQTADVTVASSTNETTIIGAGSGSVTLPAGYFTVGKTIRVAASGYYSTTSGNQPMTVTVKLNAVTILTTGANNLSGSLTDQFWAVRTAEITCRTVGETGTVMGQGQVVWSTSHTGATIDDFTPNKAALVVNTTIPQVLDITVTWGNSHASNSITATNVSVSAQ